MNISDIPCIDFFARKQAPVAREPRFWLHCINACRQAGYTVDEIRCKVEDISFIYSDQLSIMDECGNFNQALVEYAKLEGKMPPCREYAKEIGMDMDAPYASLCKVCPFSEDFVYCLCYSLHLCRLHKRMNRPRLYRLFNTTIILFGICAKAFIDNCRNWQHKR